jgi:excinuclease ABC subunit B
MYADTITGSMQLTINETNRRREKQLIYNEKMGITPAQIVRKTGSILTGLTKKGVSVKAYIEPERPDIAADPVIKYMNREALEKAIEKTRKNMEKAASELNFVEAARFRDEMADLQKLLRSKN